MFYNLDIDALVESLDSHRYTGTFRARLPVPIKVGAGKEVADAVLEVVAGQPAHCHIMSASGAFVVQGQEAYLLMKGQGSLQWTFAPFPSSVQLQQQQALSRVFRSTDVPRRLQSRPDQRAWDRSLRHVFNLIDGEKDALALAKILNKSPLELERLLKELVAIHVISWDQHR